jgi:small redox-active disulfide protein 2
MDIKVLGPGCANCKKLEQLVRDVVAELGVDINISKVTDFKEIAAFKVMRTPALVINNQVMISGMLPSKAKVTEIISAELAKKG